MLRGGWRVAAAIALNVVLPGADAFSGELMHRGTCDASAAVAVGADLMLVANDEDNVLRLYRRDVAGSPLAEFDMTEFLDVDPDDPEADIEAATTIGDRHLWITSHGRGKNGESKPSRQRLFATAIASENEHAMVRGSGRPYRNLLDDLWRHAPLRKYGLVTIAGATSTQPTELNIEGLAAMPDGRLLLGLRSPLRAGHAIVLSIENPLAVVDGAQAILGEPAELDLGGLGIRSMEWLPVLNDMLIVAGTHDESDRFALYLWSGRVDQPPRAIDTSVPRGLVPEAFVVSGGDSREVRLMSDDGRQEVLGRACKSLDAAEQRHFRSLPVLLE